MIHVIDLQKSKTSNKEVGSFTLNVGVAVKAVNYITNNGILPDQFQEVNCILRRRIGWLLVPDTSSGPKRRPLDRWWDYGPDTKAEAVASEVKDMVVNNVHAMFGQIKTPDSILRYMKDNHSPMDDFPYIQISLAILNVCCGQQYDASLFEELRRRFPTWDETISNAEKQLRRPDVLEQIALL